MIINETPIISVISVCYNCENYIEKTILSLFNQSFKQYEYIIIDGGSTDKTLDIIKKLSRHFDKIDIISEPDRGIYDAMNKGVSRATGKYIYFLNIGDEFADEFVLEKVLPFLKRDVAIYYGDIIWGNELRHSCGKATIGNLIYREQMICHQAIFAPTEAYRKYPFDLNYNICADRDWILHSIKEGVPCIYMKNVVVAKYDLEGVSSNQDKFGVDSLRVTQKYGGLLAVVFVKCKRAVGKMYRKIFGKES